MVKKRLLSLLVLLLMTATGAWADTTVTWTASDMSGIYIDFLDGEAYNNTIKGITVTSSGGGGAGASWERTDIQNSGSTTITFTSSVGNIKSIAITAADIDMMDPPSGWTTDYSTLSWSGEASTTVPLPLSGWTEISGISEIVFTIESTVNVTGITLDKTEASMIVGGETLTLTPTVAPGNATDKTVTWTSSDASVVTVANGVVTAVAPGTATITATATNGTADTSDDKTATCAVTVSTATYSVALKEGTEDAANWSATPTEQIAGQNVTLQYAGTKKVKSVKVVKKKAAAATDLSTINADYEAKDGETLTGTLASNVKISIADGATVTLDGVTINGVNDSNYEWAGITCLGDATIILSGTNTVKGFYEDYPGIQAAAAGKTLIINGTGSLTASSNGYGAGIGGVNNVACGNIEIQGGTITATSGDRGAGIGGGDRADCGNITISGGTVNATGGSRGAGIGGGRRGPTSGSCGNILISGGTVTATGGENAAGIGGGRGYNSGNLSSCGTITITTGVTKVIATKGDGADNSIGAGKYGTCGTVTIGGNVGAITTSPYTYQPE